MTSKGARNAAMYVEWTGMVPGRGRCGASGGDEASIGTKTEVSYFKCDSRAW
ncbi:hypothetical protein E2C01_054406 [Portunus trituberculatus]|uniref:Uncharacterized protein n=1 Tax=Portunus trituberculatus TaxID=210409 RepID=A0A5B7GRY0_PORTR|nr:hypothetical protein [Portunus trituberculatus]